jgi:hypothetical protein
MVLWIQDEEALALGSNTGVSTKSNEPVDLMLLIPQSFEPGIHQSSIAPDIVASVAL